jgi:ferric-dicitrate binding protein FerR (iron transport regulator)
MQLSETIIHQFLSGSLSVKEAKEVVRLLEQHPEWINQYFTETEWNNLLIPQKLSKQQLLQKFETIKPNIQLPAQKQHVRLIRMVVAATSVAAAVIMLFYTGKWLFNNSKIANADKNLVSLSIDTVTQKNTTDTIQYLALEDGSAIQLSTNSTVTFVKHFPNNKRQIQLIGTAFFNVAKDKNRPFEVQAGGFSTIALGTSFKITAPANAIQVLVQLYTGKVVVKPTNKQQVAFKSVFLIPNEQLAINTITHVTERTSIVATQNNGLAINANRSPIDMDDYITESGLQFNNTPLTTIFNVLEQHYDIHINCNTAIIKGMAFSGTFNKKEGITAVLSTLTSINKLTLLKSSDANFKIIKE